MKLCQVMLAKGFGGAERLFVDLCRALAARGHEVMAICHPRAEAAALLRGIPGVALELVPAVAVWDLLAVRRIRALFAARRPLVVGAHLARAAHLAGRAARPLGIPVIAKTHNYVDLKYYRNVDWFITTTVDQRQYLLDAGVAAGRIEVIPNFSSMPAAAEVAPPAGEIAAVGRLVPKKGMDVLLRAVAQLVGAGQDLRLRIAGEGPERERLERLAAALGLSDRVRFAGWQWDVAGFLDGAALVVRAGWSRRETRRRSRMRCGRRWPIRWNADRERSGRSGISARSSPRTRCCRRSSRSTSARPPLAQSIRPSAFRRRSTTSGSRRASGAGAGPAAMTRSAWPTAWFRRQSVGPNRP
jgi:glycosyltransferase involved in cell wall biosynthesis